MSDNKVVSSADYVAKDIEYRYRRAQDVVAVMNARRRIDCDCR